MFRNLRAALQFRAALIDGNGRREHPRNPRIHRFLRRRHLRESQSGSVLGQFSDRHGRDASGQHNAAGKAGQAPLVRWPEGQAGHHDPERLDVGGVRRATGHLQFERTLPGQSGLHAVSALKGSYRVASSSGSNSAGSGSQWASVSDMIGSLGSGCLGKLVSTVVFTRGSQPKSG
jgi:hypothetical protein